MDVAATVQRRLQLGSREFVTQIVAFPRQPSLGAADFVQYFVRKADYKVGRLDRGFLDYMLT